MLSESETQEGWLQLNGIRLRRANLMLHISLERFRLNHF
jgi:hypothetical protein